MSGNKAQGDQWSSKLGLIFAVAGSAVGLGNFLRFPGLAAQYGGGSFMIAYVIMLLLEGVPVGWAEWSLGRRGGRLGSNTGPGIFWYLTKGSKWWKLLGVITVLGPSAVAFYYMLVEAWCFDYFWKMLTSPDVFKTNQQATSTFLNFVGFGEDGGAFTQGQGLVWTLVFVIVLNLGIIYRGISKGIELFARWFMPILLVISVVLTIKVLCLGTPDPAFPDRSIEQGLGYMWNPNKVVLEEKQDDQSWKTISMLPANDATALQLTQMEVSLMPESLRIREITIWDGLKNIEMWLAAAGQVFLSLSVGTGLILTYASYIRKKEDIALSSISAAASNEVCEVGIAGMMTVPTAVAFLGVAGAAGQGTFALGFMVLPQAFVKMEGGFIFGSLFFLLLSLAAVTSSISMMQVGLAFIEEFMGLGRKMAVMVQGFVNCFGCLLVAWFSKGLLALDTYDFFIGTLCFYVSATLVIILFSWKLGIDSGIKDLENGSVIKIPKIYRFIMQYVTPSVLIGILFVWMGENIWGNPATALQSLMKGEQGAIFPLVFIIVYGLFLVFVTMSSSRHRVYRSKKKTYVKG